MSPDSQPTIQTPSPSIMLSWNAENQEVLVQFNPTQFKTWEFVLGVLEMATIKARQMKAMGDAATLQQAMQQVQHEQAILRKIARP